MMGTEPVRKVPTLVELCIQTAIDNVRYMEDVGETDILLLKEILPHCTSDQLMHIEKSTEGRDLSAVTDILWKRFYQLHFGEESMNLVIKRMKKQDVVFKWRLLYEAKEKEREEAQKKTVERIKKLYEEEGNSSSYGSNVSNTKGNLMKKAKLEFLKSHEVKVHRAISRSKRLQTKSFSSSSVPRPLKPSVRAVGSSSSSYQKKPIAR